MAKKKTETTIKMVDDTERSLLVHLQVSEIIHKEKKNMAAICLYGQVKGGPEDKRLFTVNLNLNNLTPDGETELKKLLGTKVYLKTPIVATLSIPKGSLLDDWTKATSEAQSTLDDHDQKE